MKQAGASQRSFLLWGLNSEPNAHAKTPLGWLAACALIALVLADLIFVNSWAQTVLTVHTALPPQADAIVVLGCPTLPNGSPSPCQQERVKQAEQLYWQFSRQTPPPHLIVSGGAVHNAYSEAQTLRQMLLQAGIPDRAVTLEMQARNTVENARYALKIAQGQHWQHLIVVTSAYHSRRSWWIFKDLLARQPQADFSLALVPAPVGKLSLCQKWQLSTHEMLGLFYYFAYQKWF